MTYLVDANVLSEFSKSNPEARVIVWLRDHERELAVDPIILGEIRYGIHLLLPGARRRRLEEWFQHVVQKITCIPWTAPTGLRWAALLAELRKSGRPVPVKDSLIAATALLHGLTIVTRNVGDFTKTGAGVLNPFG
jgi:predicted nucleic acid-binding protein